MAPEIEKRGYLHEDFRLFHLRDAQGPDVGYHYHEFHKILLLLSGKGFYAIEGNRYRLQTGDMVIVGSGTVHRPEFEPGTPYERYILYISPSFLHSVPGAEECTVGLFSGEMGSVAHPDEAERRRLLEWFAALEKERQLGAFGSRLAGQGMVLSLLAGIGRLLQGGAAKKPERRQVNDGKIRELIAYIDGHLTEELTVDDLSKVCYLSKYHMMRRFREETGESVHAYLTGQRLLSARELLDKGCSATEACFQSGFRSYSAFTRSWCKMFGTTPTGRRSGPTDYFDV